MFIFIKISIYINKPLDTLYTAILKNDDRKFKFLVTIYTFLLIRTVGKKNSAFPRVSTYVCIFIPILQTEHTLPVVLQVRGGDVLRTTLWGGI